MSTNDALLEPSEGSTIGNPSEEQILAVLRRIGHGLEHCNFSCGDSSISAASGAGNVGLYLFHSDNSGLELESGGLNVETACRVFVEFRDGGTGWKTEYGFKALGKSDGKAPRGEGSQGAGTRGTGSQNLKDRILGTAQREAGHGLLLMVKRLVKGFFRK
ncbi:MAG: hypothetical protein NT080_09630 [Spirochaetes bacterium]|nr:hypothetical protein [Spirochaetota bacterium]